MTQPDITTDLVKQLQLVAAGQTELVKLLRPKVQQAGVKFTDYRGGNTGAWIGAGPNAVNKIKVPSHLPHRTIYFVNNSALGGPVKLTARLSNEVVFMATLVCTNHIRWIYYNADLAALISTGGEFSFFAYCDEIEFDDTASGFLLTYPEVKSEAILPA